VNVISNLDSCQRLEAPLGSFDCLSRSRQLHSCQVSYSRRSQGRRDVSFPGSVIRLTASGPLVAFVPCEDAHVGRRVLAACGRALQRATRS